MAKYNNNPIGFFDSGLGGTSIWKEVVKLLPAENTIYLSDSKNAPYGEKSKQEIIDLAIKNTEFLLKKGCKLIVIACNTATTNAIKVLRNNYDIPFIGIEPAIKPAALQTKTNNIAILATKSTLNSNFFEKSLNLINKNIKHKKIAGKGLVELVENGKLHSTEMTNLLLAYIKPIINTNVDCLVLGCTHYAYLIPQIKEIIGEFLIIDPSMPVAKQTKVIIENNQIARSELKKSNYKFFINSNKKHIEALLSNENKGIEIIERDF